ncbi:hypothetical protein [Bacillus cereus]|uniref:hypothetical protein n=1 Tax=Bacillus cereus TaxID=1396 RepID=UPI000696992C|nr:hypothetical protein [Bacillus cereus]
MNTDEKISITNKKTLKLNNVLIAKVKNTNPLEIQKTSHMMQSYVKSHGKFIVGPLISHSYSTVDSEGNIQFYINLIMQLDSPHYISDINYEFKKQIKLENCLFARFNDEETNVRFAYLKLNVYAFENNLNLQGESYTIYIEQKRDKLLADIFMPLQD